MAWSIGGAVDSTTSPVEFTIRTPTTSRAIVSSATPCPARIMEPYRPIEGRWWKYGGRACPRSPAWSRFVGGLIGAATVNPDPCIP